MATLPPAFQQDAARPEASLPPKKEYPRRTEVTARRRQGSPGRPRKGCGSDPPAPRFGPRSPARGPGPIPSRPERPLVSLAGLPSPSGSGLRSPARGQRQEGGQRMRRLSPGEGREAGPYLIAEDAVRLVTAGRHGGTQLGLARGLQAERQQPARSGRL